ncbi:MAG: phenylalanine--tRNA ligase subunit alpha [Rickettsiales bacterium]|jgi:phenylalanyl-tRNA synthetase alpha chain|nr:phenylalanine--tRNA ligase subunit alpha [Rickettsiales bacterium]
MLDKQEEVLNSIKSTNHIKDLEELRIQYLGKNGLLTNEMKKMASLSLEDKKTFGALLNTLKSKITNAIDNQKILLEENEINTRLSSEKIDVTQPVRRGEFGKIHPITQATQEIINIFANLGFDLAQGPEIEDDYHNFTALNIPENHPARQMHDTFYMNTIENMTLRTHTSNVQIRKMSSEKPPFRFIAPGRVYRSDHDQTHTPMFNQVEGLCIDKNINMGNLKWCLEEFLKAFFETDKVVIRLRPSFFPFTEPSAEVDIGYKLENGEIKIGSNEKWLDILGCGMVHRKVIENVGLNPDEYQGFAFGVGIDRIAMLKYGIHDLRKFFESDMRWNNHFGFSLFDMPSLVSGLSK